MTKYNFGKAGQTDHSSKYGLGGCLDTDIRANEARYHRRYKYIEQIVQKIMWQDPVRQNETMEIFIKVLRGMKE